MTSVFTITEEQFRIAESRGLSRAEFANRIRAILHPDGAESHTPLPVAGYTAQSDAKVALVNEFKADEERLLRKLDALSARNEHERRRKNLDAIYTDTLEADEAIPLSDPRWLAIARTHFQEGFMALNRAVFQPQRIRLPEDDVEAAAERRDLP